MKPSTTELMSYEELGNELGLAPTTLMNWKCQGIFKEGRDYIKLGKGPKAPVRFKRAVIERVLDQSLWR